MFLLNYRFLKKLPPTTGLCAGWELAFCPPGPLLIENILMKLRTKVQ